MTFDLGKLLLELIAAAVGTVGFSILFQVSPGISPTADWWAPLAGWSIGWSSGGPGPQRWPHFWPL